jgi:ketosteroid isomerase-like protein
MRKLLIGLMVAVLAVALTACGDEAQDPAAQEMRQQSDYWLIDQIEKDFHHATTTKNIELMMSLWAPNATLTVGPGETASGTDAIRTFWLTKSTAFDPAIHWLSDHPAYKLEITVAGDRGTLHFECHYVDYDKAHVDVATVADMDVARIDGHWLITNFVAGSTELRP